MGARFYIAQLGEARFPCFCDCSGAESFNCVFNLAGLLQKFQVYCTFQKQNNSENQKPPSQLHFSLQSIIITITSNEPWNTGTHKTDRNSPIINQNHDLLQPSFKVNFCFLRGHLRWLRAAKNSNVSWLLNFRIHAVIGRALNSWIYFLFVSSQSSQAYAMGNPCSPALSKSLDSRKPGCDEKPVLTICQGQVDFPFGQRIVR